VQFGIREKVGYAGNCLTDRPIFRVGVRAGCPHFIEQWEEEMAIGQVRRLLLDCGWGWEMIMSAGRESVRYAAVHPFGQ
jgi:hypothetical protein